MGFFEKLGDKLSEVGSGAVKKTKELTEITKLNMHIGSEEDNIQEMYMKIGKMYFECIDNIEDERFAPLFNSIQESLKRIENYKEQIKKLKGSELKDGEEQTSS